jgi:hypothetical protein
MSEPISPLQRCQGLFKQQQVPGRKRSPMVAGMRCWKRSALPSMRWITSATVWSNPPAASKSSSIARQTGSASNKNCLFGNVCDADSSISRVLHRTYRDIFCVRVGYWTSPQCRLPNIHFSLDADALQFLPHLCHISLSSFVITSR